VGGSAVCATGVRTGDTGGVGRGEAVFTAAGTGEEGAEAWRGLAAGEAACVFAQKNKAEGMSNDVMNVTVLGLTRNNSNPIQKIVIAKNT